MTGASENERSAAMQTAAADQLYYLLYDLPDPEFPDQTLESLGILERISVQRWRGCNVAEISIKPTAGHCSHVAAIALSIVKRLEEEVTQEEKRALKIVIRVVEHKDADELTRRVNDKERVKAALERPSSGAGRGDAQ